MKKCLEINLYADGYDVTQLNCVDLPIAGASGYYDYNNYFYYCLYYNIFDNWGSIDSNNFLPFRNNILNKLGLYLKPIAIENSASFISLVKSEIDNQHPLLMLTKYYTLFYHNGYLDNEYRHINHGIIVNGYDSEKSLICIKEYSHIENDIDSLLRCYLLCNLMLTEDIIKDIWTKSNIIFKEEGFDNNFGNIFTIESIGKTQITCYEDLLKDILDNIDIKSDKLVGFIKNFNSIYNNINNPDCISELRKTYVNSLTILFDVFERTFIFLKQNQGKQDEYNNIKNKYLQTRSLILNKLIANVFRGKTICEETEKNLIDQILSLDSELFSYVRNLQRYRMNIGNNLSVYTFSPTEQAQIRDGQFANTNLANTKLLIVNNFPEPNRNYEVFIKFDLGSIEIEKCLSAKFKIYSNLAQSPTPVEIYSALDDTWSDTKITWNNKPVISNNLLASQVVSTQKTWYAFDVTSLVNDKLTSNKIISLCIRVEPEANVGVNFFSKYAANNKPILEVVPI